MKLSVIVILPDMLVLVETFEVVVVAGNSVVVVTMLGVDVNGEIDVVDNLSVLVGNVVEIVFGAVS